MDSLIALLINYGYWGMFLSAVLAGSVVPFSSEAVMVGLQAAGLKAWPLILYGTAGNVIGGMINYGVGRLGRTDWIEKYLHIKKEKLQKAENFMAAWMGFFAFLPILGSAITVVLGLMRANVAITVTSMTIGKFIRFALLVFGASFLI